MDGRMEGRKEKPVEYDLSGCTMTHRVRIVQVTVLSLDFKEGQVDGVLKCCLPTYVLLSL